MMLADGSTSGTTPNEKLTSSARLAALRFICRQPGCALSQFVHCFWSVENPAGQPPVREYWYPDGGLGLTFSVSAPVLVGNDTFSRGARMDGALTGSLQLSLPPNARLIGVRLRPGAAARFFSSISGSLPDQKLARELQVVSQALEVSSTPLDTLEDWLNHRLQAPLGFDALVDQALCAVSNDQQLPSFTQLTAALGVSPRTLQRAFLKTVGTSLQQLLALRRVGRARSLVKQGVRFADVAIVTGYYDQAHFAREFRQIMGTSPGGYLQRRSLLLLQHNRNQGER